MIPTHILPSNILTSEPSIKRLKAIVMILRNLSHVQANVRFLLHSSPGILRILTGCLCYRNFVTSKNERTHNKAPDDGESGTGNSYNNVCLHAVNALTNLVPFLDRT